MVGAHTRGEPRTTPCPPYSHPGYCSVDFQQGEALGPETFNEDLGLFSPQGLVASWAEVACMSSRDSRILG